MNCVKWPSFFLLRLMAAQSVERCTQFLGLVGHCLTPSHVVVATAHCAGVHCWHSRHHCMQWGTCNSTCGALSLDARATHRWSVSCFGAPMGRTLCVSFGVDCATATEQTYLQRLFKHYPGFCRLVVGPVSLFVSCCKDFLLSCLETLSCTPSLTVLNGLSFRTPKRIQHVCACCSVWAAVGWQELAPLQKFFLASDRGVRLHAHASRRSSPCAQQCLSTRNFSVAFDLVGVSFVTAYAKCAVLSYCLVLHSIRSCSYGTVGQMDIASVMFLVCQNWGARSVNIRVLQV